MSTRRYDSSRRKEAAAQTKHQVLEAGRHLFLERGYAATTMSDVAARARVSAATANAAFGGKAGLLKRLIDVSIVGDEEDVPVSERAIAREVAAETDPRRQCQMLAAFVAGVHQRLAPLMEVMHQAAGADDQVRAQASKGQEGRRQGMAEFVALISPEALRPGLDADRAADIVWALTEHRLFVGLVHERGWSIEEYTAWLGDQIATALLG
ncbi:MAG TPA: TetR family transcriptional regulator [Actinomycetes bacterium]|nr:TetR family transcriptional regulator [Actinomycetes bacterium]